MVSYESLKHPDLVYSQNNGVIALLPTKGGRLKRLHKNGSVWIFHDESVQHHPHMLRLYRGVASGTAAEFQTLVQKLRAFGMLVQSGSFFVPCSNGPARECFTRDGKRMDNDWAEEELEMVRFDRPTWELLFTHFE